MPTTSPKASRTRRPLLGALLLVLTAVAAHELAPRLGGLSMATFGSSEPSTPAQEDSQAALKKPFPTRSVRSFSSLQVVQKEERPYQEYIAEAAARHQIDPALIRAVIHVESNFEQRAVSPVGARGLMQLMPATAQRFGLQRRRMFDARENIRAGAAYLSVLADRFGENNSDLILAAYNAGEGNVSRFGGIPPFPQTQEYVRKVHELWGQPIAGVLALSIDG